MKKRLSLLMALMMVLSLVPMSVFAASTPYTSVASVTTDDTQKKVSVTFELDKNLALTDGIVRFELSNAEFATTPYAQLSVGTATTAPTGIFSNFAFFDTTSIATAAVVGSNVNVVFTADLDFSDSSTGDVVLSVLDEGDTGIGDQEVKIAVVKEASTSDAAITVKDSAKKVGLDGGALSQFEIRNFGKLDGTTTNNVVVELADGFTFTAATKIYVDGVQYTPVAAFPTNTLVIPATASTKSIIVEPEVSISNKADFGDVVVNVTFDKDGSIVVDKDATVGQLVDFEVSLKIVEDGKKEIPTFYGGYETKTVKVTLSGVKGSIGTRTIDFNLDDAKVKPGSINTDIMDYTTDTAGYIVDGEFSIAPNSSTLDKIEFTMVVESAWNKDVTATLNAKTREYDLTADVAVIKPIFTVETKVQEVKKGEAQEMATIVITEAKQGLIKANSKIALELDAKNGVEFGDEELTVSATNSMELDDTDYTTSVNNLSITIPVDRAARTEAGVITVEDVILAVSGSTIDHTAKINVLYNGNKVATVDYAKIVKEYGATSSTSVFTIGSKNYTVNDEAKTAVEAPYVQAGRTMLPIRAVAESLGLKVDYNSVTKQITFTNDTKVATLVVGADTMYVNGSPVKLSVPSTLKSNTTFVELRSLATAFGVTIEWDAATKTVTING